MFAPGSFSRVWKGLSLAKRCASTSSAGVESLFGLAWGSGIRWNCVGLGILIDWPAASWFSRPRGVIELCSFPEDADAYSPIGCMLLLRLSSIISCLIASIVPCLVRTAYSIPSVASVLSFICNEAHITMRIRTDMLKHTIINPANSLYHPGC